MQKPDPVGLYDLPAPPSDVHDASGWDRYWDKEIRRGFHSLGFFTPVPGLLPLMVQRRLRTALCVGNGLSIEPLILAGAGFAVTALDLSARATDFWRARGGSARHDARRFAVKWLVGNLRDYRFLHLRGGGLNPPVFRRLACRILFGWPRGHVDFVQGDFLDATVCPGPFDVVVEHHMLHLYPEPQRAAGLERLVARLHPRGVFASVHHYSPVARGRGCFPFDSLPVYDRTVAERHQEAFGRTHAWLREHGFSEPDSRLAQQKGVDVFSPPDVAADGPVALLTIWTG